MMNLRFTAIAFMASIAFASYAGAAVPAGYKGQPYKGTPWPIPGRIDLVNYDTGGLNVGFNTVHHGDVACPGTDYRNDVPVPTLCKTSTTTGQFNDKPDQYTAGPLMGTCSQARRPQTITSARSDPEIGSMSPSTSRPPARTS